MYVGQGDILAHSSAGLVLDYHWAKATGTNQGVNSPATTIWSDLSGNGNNGALVNSAYMTTSGWNSGYVADGVDDYIDCGNGSSLNLTSELTIELWISGFTATVNKTLIGRNYTNSYYVNSYQGNITFHTANVSLATSNNIINDGALHQIIITKKTDGTKEIYKNGVLQVTGNGSLASSADHLYIGNSPNVHNYPSAKFYIARVYNRALTQDEITQNYNQGVAWPTSNADVTINAIMAQSTIQAYSPNISANSLLNVIDAISNAYAITPKLATTAAINAVSAVANFYAVSPTIAADAVIRAIVANSISQAYSPQIKTTGPLQLLKAKSYMISRNTSSKIITRKTSCEVID
jgi:hypothetical protein